MEVNPAETVAFARAACRERVQATKVCNDEKAWLRLEVRFRAAREQKFSQGSKCSKDRQEFFVPRGGKPSPDSSGKTNRRSRDEVGGQAMGRPNPPANEGNISRNGHGHWDNYEEVRSRHEIIRSV